MLVVAVRMWLRKAPRLPARPGEDDPGAVWKVGVAGLLVGVLTGFFGVGGGFLIVPALALALGMPMAMAVGTSLLIIAINSASGIVAHLGTGGVDLPVAFFFIGGGLVGAFVGGRLAGKIDERALSRVLGHGRWHRRLPHRPECLCRRGRSCLIMPENEEMTHSTPPTRYGFGAMLAGPLDDAVERTKEALRAKGSVC